MKVGKDFRPEYSPLPDDAQAVPGFNEPKIIKGISVRDQKKRCFLNSSWGSLSEYDTNDVRMKWGSSAIRVTKTAYYLVAFSSDVTPGWTTAQCDLLVNWWAKATTLYQNYYTLTSRIILTGTKMLKLKTGDAVSLSISGWTVNYNYATYLQVLEL